MSTTPTMLDHSLSTSARACDIKRTVPLPLSRSGADNFYTASIVIIFTAIAGLIPHHSSPSWHSLADVATASFFVFTPMQWHLMQTLIDKFVAVSAMANVLCVRIIGEGDPDHEIC
jgi:hypothetical protein